MLLSSAGDENKRIHMKNDAIVFQVQWTTFQNESYIMIATSEGFQLWDAEGQRMVHFYTLCADEMAGQSILQRLIVRSVIKELQHRKQ